MDTDTALLATAFVALVALILLRWYTSPVSQQPPATLQPFSANSYKYPVQDHPNGWGYFTPFAILCHYVQPSESLAACYPGRLRQGTSASLSPWNSHKVVLFQYRGSAFKAPFLDQWVVMVSGPRLVDELRRRPESELSLATAITEVSQLRARLPCVSSQQGATVTDDAVSIHGWKGLLG